MNPDTRRWLLLVAGVFVGYAVMLRAHPARSSLRDGLRCLRRHPQLWLVPALFGVAHAAFSLWVRVYEAWSIPDAPPALVPWNGWQPSEVGDALARTWLPTAEGAASLFNCVVTAFPLSAGWAALLLVNWRGYQAVLYRGLRRRCGQALSLLIHAFIVLCALAALCKPVLFGGLPRLNAYYGEAVLLRAGELVNALSFFFEYLLGVAVQAYLVLRVFAWIRGLTVDFDGLCRFALRRLVFVCKWAGVILAVTALGINLPLVVASFRPTDAPWEPVGILHGTRWLLAVALILLCPVQALLVFHNGFLRQALRDAAQLWRRYGWHVGWLIVTATLHFFLVALLGAFLSPALGQWTWPATVWNVLVYPLLWSACAGWFLASWVCLFRRCERNSPGEADLVRF